MSCKHMKRESPCPCLFLPSAPSGPQGRPGLGFSRVAERCLPGGLVQLCKSGSCLLLPKDCRIGGILDHGTGKIWHVSARTKSKGKKRLGRDSLEGEKCRAFVSSTKQPPASGYVNHYSLFRRQPGSFIYLVLNEQYMPVIKHSDCAKKEMYKEK